MNEMEKEQSLETPPHIIHLGITGEEHAHRKNSIAIADFANGDTRVVEADRLYLCVPTKDCVQFWVMICACAIVAGVGLVLMIVRGTADNLFYLWEALFALSFGVLVPSPNYSSAFKKKKDGGIPTVP